LNTALGGAEGKGEEGGEMEEHENGGEGKGRGNEEKKEALHD
jgi:hypothetical protein